MFANWTKIVAGLTLIAATVVATSPVTALGVAILGVVLTTTAGIDEMERR